MINLILQYLVMLAAGLVCLVIVAVVGTAMGWWDWVRSVVGDSDDE